MPEIEIPSGFQGAEKLPRTRRSLQGCFNDGQGAALTMPGVELISTPGGVGRGIFEWNDSLYVLFSQQLSKVTDVTTGALSSIGTVEDSAPIQTARGFNDTAIVVPGSKTYSLSTADVFADISGNSNFVPWADVTHIDNRFIYVPDSGDPTKFSDPGLVGTIQALSFFDAEELPDKNNGCAEFKNTLFITGTDSIQPFRNAGTTPNPFVRISGGRILTGFIGGLLEYNRTFVYLGRETNQDFGIYNIQGDKISNERIDLILSTYTISELASVIVSRVKWRGYDLAIFKLPRDSFGFLGGNWFILDTIVDDTSGTWGASFTTEFEGEYYTVSGGRFGKYADINTVFGDRTTHIIDFNFEHPDNKRFTCQSIEVLVSQGFNAAVGSVTLFMSRDGVDFGQPVSINLGAIGKYGDRLRFNMPGGLGNYEGFMFGRIYSTEDVHFSVSKIIANFR